ncbi:class I SAM-dependent methyltransferase [Francisella frigiditurris]|uniref:Cyclopropane-fatty-acyl-phospholipid synthase n=1 Tax=Francisella frigiditurris TaxID=1542390 RepID=A0A1J0KUF8_9GAMM|nr:class I SAM-dependent methyltransferase [Francisella frigiditurris]APC97385.1 cyclopropane-fatty-acyl-phospholipid synthase [Francisella frigiditurris]
MIKTANNWNADLYDSKANFVTNYGDDVIELLAPKFNEIILDLGCGTGRLANTIAESGAKVTGVDYSLDMVNRAKKLYPNIDFHVADAQQSLDFSENSFDAVFSNAALHWMIDAESVIKNVAKVLKPNGRFVFEMGGKGNIDRLLFHINNISQEFNLTDYHIKNYYPSISEYSSLLEKNGFAVRFAVLFDRPTKLEGEDGITNWVTNFRADLLERVEDKEKFFTRLKEVARADLLNNGDWYADYVRLRMVATYK